MRFSKQCVEALERLANNPSLDLNSIFEPNILNADGFPISDAFMQPGALLAAITSNAPEKASLLLTIGAKTNKRYALALLDDSSTFLEISDDMLNEIKLDLAHITGYPATGYGTRKTGRKLKQGRRILPLGPKDIKEWLSKTTTTKAVEMMKGLTKTKSFENWVRAAALSKLNDTGTSQVQVTASPIDPKDIPQEVWDQFRSDVEEKKDNCPEYTTEIEPIFQQFYTADTTATTAETPPPPPPQAGTGQQQQAPTTPQQNVSYTDPEVSHLFTIPATNQPSPPAQPRLKRTRFGFDEHVPRYGGQQSSRREIVTPSPPTTNAQIQAKYMELQSKACSGQLLSPRDWDLYKMLHQNITNNPVTPKPSTAAAAASATNISLNMPNILSFAHVNKAATDLFHKDTNNMWSKAATHKAAQAKMIIKIELDKLIRKDASFSFCIHAQLLETLVNVNFEPGDMYSPKPHLGLSVLAFVPRESKEIKGLAHQTELIERANFVTTEDTNKTKLGAPMLPNTLSETVDVLKRCATFIAFILGEDCPYGRACLEVNYVLQRKYELFYKMGNQFGPVYGHEILYQLHLLAIEFFGSTTTEEEYNAGRALPTTNTTWLLQAISSQQLQNSTGRPEMFGAKPTKPTNTTGTQTNQARNNQNGQRSQTRQSTNRVKQERKLPADFIKAHEEFTAKTSKKMTIANIRKGLDISDPTEFATLHGLDKTKDCFRIHFLGVCPGCSLGHTVNPNFKRDVALESLKKATSA